MTTWFEFWADAKAKKATPSADVTHVANSGDITHALLATKQGATGWYWSNQLEEASASTDHQLGIVAYPGPTGHQWARASLYWSIYRGSKYADVAADVIQFLVNDPDAGKILGAERGLAPNLDVRKQILPSLTPAMRTSAQFETTLSAQFSATPPPPPRGHTQIRTYLTSAAESVGFGKASVKDAARQFIERANSALTM
jgi:multiple sugar transport system substrate-binding protein